MNYQQTGQVSLSGGPQVWDPGARILIYSDNSKTNTGLETKEKTKHSKQSRFLNTRASPNKSQDSGFSDSGESETSTASETKGHHVTKIYFYSNNAESHYQCPSSLPVFSTEAGNGKQRSYTHSLSVPDVTQCNHQLKSNKREHKNVVIVEGDSRNNKSISRVSVDGSHHQSQIRKAKAWSSEKLTPIKPTRERNYPSWSSSSDNKIYDDKSENDKRQTRLNSIAELLEHFRKEDSSQKDDMKSISSSPTHPAGSGSLSSSSVISSKPDIQTTGSPVDHWLSELPSLYESECSVMLQSKSLQGFNKLSAYKAQVYQDIKIIQDNAREVTKSFAELCRMLSSHIRKDKIVGSIKYLEYQVQRLINLNCVTKFRPTGGQLGDLNNLPGLRLSAGLEREEVHEVLDTEHNSVIMREHQKILNYIHDLKFCAAHMRKGHLAEMVKSATKFGSCITVLVEEMLSSKVGQIVSSLNSPSVTVGQVESCLVSITSLGLEGNHLCRLMTKHGAVSLLVHLLSTSDHRAVRAATLRALATLCSVLEAIRQLEEVRGVEVIAKLLSDLSVTESERAEAAGVLAQVTSPWIEDNDYVLGVTENAFNLVNNLTELCRNTRCDETFLLGSAALANLSFLSPLILTAMSSQDTVRTMLQYLSRTVSPSIYIQDQVATVIANMAARQDTQEALLSCNLVNVLLHLLAANPNTEDLPVLAATQRVQQKAAIAIGRLSAQPSLMSGLMSGSALERLVELSVCKKARLDSDSTLVAVITAVRKISQSQNISSILDKLGASELIDSCLLSSFKIFSTKHESFV